MRHPPSLQTLTLGDSDELRPGELAIAIGNPIGLDRSISVGVISGLGRTLRDGDRPMRHIIQTDATLNPGNSGGALLNAAGEVIGITNAIERAAGRTGFGGIGYAVPSSSVKRFADRLLAGEHIRHAWLGISGQDVTPSAARELGVTVSRGVAIGSVVGVGPAARAGLRKGDVITAVDRAPVETMDAFGAYLDRTYRPGDRVTLTISRGSETIETMATLEPWPEGDMAP
ncbi:MAG: PDZ domain-containing protein [Proteobacteria bacterium]|nr:PDZ domain-containing protein [Pseudomonadota bacterium]